MIFQFEKFSFNKIIYFFSFTLILFTFACEAPQTTTTTNQIVANNAPVSAPSAAPAQQKSAGASLPVTLPVLDAMFADETFAVDLKSKLQLTDEQIDRVKTTAREAVSNLSEEGYDENSGSTRAAVERSNTQIRAILGEEKANQLFEMVRLRWNGGDDAGNIAANPGARPNSVPSDTRVVVNAPAYRMDLFDDGKLVKTYKIGIGYPEFPLPVGMRKADTIIFNPTWTPPDEPWVKGKFAPGKTVEAGSKDNPLGPIKIPIGLPSLIHGGKSAARLGSFASHGCVGLTNPQIKDFAFNIARLSGMDLMPEDVKNYEKQKSETKNVKLGNAVPVELRYETIVVEDGKLKIFRDVYERGTNTEENLRAVLDGYGVSIDNLNPQLRQRIVDGLKQMAIDAAGQPVDPNGNKNSNGNSNSNSNGNKNSNANSKANANADGGSVTRSIKGKKEVSFDVAELKGKGFPAPVNLSQQ
ncbi:MAG TPA: L,D-transpeptidase family protein [Pyrinomonadaceae bacterium]|nr:L,D-transpeptidase family protein [Pyrinomonadaceae bacterium]